MRIGAAKSPVATRRLGHARVQIVVGNLADDLGAMAVVHPTSVSLSFDGAIGSALLARCDRQALIEACSKAAPLEVSDVFVTPGFGLPSANIIHCRGPRFGAPDAGELIRKTCWNIVSAAEMEGFESIAIPAIGAGSKGFPLIEVARLVIQALKESSPEFDRLRTIKLVLQTDEDAAVFANELLRPPRIPDDAIPITMSSEFTPREFEAMRRGFLGDHDTKWFLYFEEPWLRVHRGVFAEDSCYFWLKIPESTVPRPFLEVLMRRDAPWSGREAPRDLEYLLDDRFGLLFLSEDSTAIGNARIWMKRGKVALNSPLTDHEDLLSASQARALGEILLEIAGRLPDQHFKA